MVQTILLYGSETWVLLASMNRKVEGVYTGILCRIKGKRAKQLRDRKCEMPGADGVLEKLVTQSVRTYIGRR